MSYFVEVTAEVVEAAARYTTDHAFLHHVAALEAEVYRQVSLCVGDREFPDDLREEALVISATMTVRSIGPGIPPIASVVKQARIERGSPMIASLRSLFERVAEARIATRFGLLSADPREDVKRRDAHDLAKYRPFSRKEG